MKREYPEEFFSRGICFEKNEAYQKAIDDFSEVIKLNPVDAEAFYRRGVSYYHKGEDEKATSDLKKAVDLGHSSARKFLKDIIILIITEWLEIVRI
ncbi:MAG: tetratricopeptide repeat protein [Acidobacteriota bacterium]